MATTSFFPTVDKEQLKKDFVGKSLKDVPTPSAVLDLSKIKANCERMLEASDQLKFGWRAHIKTHKTTELTRLQVGSTGPVKIIVSTIIEAERILPLLLEYQTAGREVNLLYSFPISPSAVHRLSTLNLALGSGGLSLIVDHPSQLPSIIAIHVSTAIAPSIFLKIDMGTHRAGVIPQSESASQMISSILALESLGKAQLLGIYAHAGHSYSSSNPATAIDFLRQEFEALLVVAGAIQSGSRSQGELVLSVGATPTTTSVRNLLVASTLADEHSEEGKAIAALKATIEVIRTMGCKIEIHAGVYAVLDLQQLATHALPTSGQEATLTWSDLAFTVLAEVVSLYPKRGRNGSAEALVGSGSLALGREPCKAYPGWGIPTPWNIAGGDAAAGGVEEHAGWRVGRISQEHGVLTWAGEVGREVPLEVGQKVRIWPNHACVAGVGFSWYLVVDSSVEGKEDEIVDVWPRWTGW